MNKTYNIYVSYQYIATIQPRISINYWRITEFLKNIFVTVKRYCTMGITRTFCQCSFYCLTHVQKYGRASCNRSRTALCQSDVLCTEHAQCMATPTIIINLRYSCLLLFPTRFFRARRSGRNSINGSCCLATRNCGCYFFLFLKNHHQS